MRLAVLLHKTLREILAIDAEEFLLWQAWLAENDPEETQDLRSALVCAVIANTSGGKRRYSVGDFMPRKRAAAAADDEAVKRVFVAWAKAHGAKVD